MDKKFRAKLKTADEILGTKGVTNFKKTDRWAYTDEMNEKAKRGEVCTNNVYPQSDITPPLFRIVFDGGVSCVVHETWLKDVEEVEIKAESKYPEFTYPEFTEENVDGILEKCTAHINELLYHIPHYVYHSFKTSIGTPDKKIENFMNAKKQLALKIVDTLSKMFKSSCCPFCEANTTVDESIPNYPCIKIHCSECSYGKYYNTCEESYSSIYHNIRKANEQLRKEIEKYWR